MLLRFRAYGQDERALALLDEMAVLLPGIGVTGGIGSWLVLNQRFRSSQ